MENFKDVKVGDRLICINQEGWDGDFVWGGFYKVTEVMESGSYARIGDVLVHEAYAEDFIPEALNGQLESYKATDFTVDVDGKTFAGFSVDEGMIVRGTQEELESPSGYVTKTTHQSVGDVTRTVSYHFEKYEDFQRYEDSLKEED